eukprot:3281307-Amphidinium_carterae.1
MAGSVDIGAAAQVLDHSTSGETCQACDVIVQRIKALETSASQGHWLEARWVELVPLEHGTVEARELKEAQRREKLDRALQGGARTGG